MIDIDWEEYFREFCSVHGRPIEVDGALLFPDGWRYSATDHSGPETPPSGRIETQQLQLRYWRERNRQARAALVAAEAELKNLKEMQGLRSAPLRTSTMTRTGEHEYQRRVSGIDWEGLLLNLKQLRAELRVSRDRLAELTPKDQQVA